MRATARNVHTLSFALDKINCIFFSMKTLKEEYKKLLKKIKQIKTIDDLKDFIKEYFKNKEVKVFLFGSRATRKQSLYSDIDLAVESQKDVSKKPSLLKELLEESNLPYKMDIIDLREIPYLRETIEKEGIRWL